MIKHHPLVGSTLVALWYLCFFITLSLHAEEIENASARAFNAAAALQNAGLHSRASEKWAEFIAQYPNDMRIGRAHYFLGVCSLHEKKFNEAAATFQTVLSRWPSLTEADKAQYNLAMSRYELAATAKNVDGFRQAAKDFELVAGKYPSSELADDAFYFQGDSLYHAGDLPSAVTAYQNLLAQHPNSTQAARAYYDLGLTQQTLGELASAAKSYQMFLDKPEYATHELAHEIRLRLGICLQTTGELDKAAEQFSRVSQVAEFELAPFASLQLGRIKHQQDKFEEAANLLKEFPTKYPKSEYLAEALKTAGYCYYLADKPQEAVGLLTPIANSNDPPAAEATLWLGRAQLKLKQPDQSLQTLELGIGRFSTSPFFTYLQFARIDSLFELPNRLAETPVLYEAFLREHPEHPHAPQAAYMAAFSSFGQRLYPKAREISEAYLAKPEHSTTTISPDMRFIAAESYLLEMPENAEAIRKAESLYRDLVSKHPEHSRAARAWLRIGWCLQATNKHQEAIDSLRGALPKLEPLQQVPEAQLLIGISHGKLAQHREALAAFNAAIAANANWPRLDEVLLAAAESHRMLNELAPSVAMYRRLVDTQAKSSRRPTAMYALGELAQQQAQLDEAIQWFQQLASQYADSDLAGPSIHTIAALQITKQQFPQARDTASRLVDGKYSDELRRRGRYLRGIAFHGENNFTRAVEDLATYRQNPVIQEETINAGYVIVMCQISLKQLDAAQGTLAELLKLKPDFARADRAYYELAHALRGPENKIAAASVAFQWIADNRPDSDLAAESWFRVAQYQAEIARQTSTEQKIAAFNQAETAVQKGLVKASEPSLRENMQYLLGDLQFQQQRFADAAATLSKQLADYPNGKYTGTTTFILAQARYELQQFDQALPLFNKASEVAFADLTEEQIKTYRSQSLYRAGVCATNLKLWPESQASFQKLINQDPQFTQRAEAKYGIAFALQQQNQLEPAIETYNQVTKETETETAAKARFMIGEIEFGRKQYQNAIEQFLLVTVGYPYESWQALARFETARCFLELGDKVRATKTLHELIEKHANHARSGDAQKMLTDLNK